MIIQLIEKPFLKFRTAFSFCCLCSAKSPDFTYCSTRSFEESLFAVEVDDRFVTHYNHPNFPPISLLCYYIWPRMTKYAVSEQYDGASGIRRPRNMLNFQPVIPFKINANSTLLRVTFCLLVTSVM
jgi:hypothetical protein